MALQKPVGFVEVALATVLTGTLVGAYWWAAETVNYHAAEALTAGVLSFFIGIAAWASTTRKTPNASLPHKVGVTLATLASMLVVFLLLEWVDKLWRGAARAIAWIYFGVAWGSILLRWLARRYRR
jgi:hypothetical protein